MRAAPAGLALLIPLLGGIASGQSLEGYASVTFDRLPRAEGVTEVRTKIRAGRRLELSPNVRIVVFGFVAGLLADREGRKTAAAVEPEDVYLQISGDSLDLQAGYMRVPWGKLDEIQPTDVINPLDVASFFLEGRADARLSVPVIRLRRFWDGGGTLEAVAVPVFRRGRFDLLDEKTSPFAIDGAPRQGLVVERREPAAGWSSLQGGIRFAATSNRVDWSISAYRGLEPFGAIAPGAGPLPPAAPPEQVAAVMAAAPLETFPRQTMIGADMETVRGAWILRAELAAFPEDTVRIAGEPFGAEGRSFNGGMAVERQSGNYRLTGMAVIERRTSREIGDTDVSLAVAGERRFSRETRFVRLFGLADLTDAATFVRIVAGVNLRPAVWLEGSAGWFAGEGTGLVGRYADRDFLSVRLRCHF